MSLVMVDPLPVNAKFATVLPTAKVVTSTSPESVAVPPALLIVKVVTPLIAPDAVMSAFAILFSVVKVSVFEPPVTAPMVKSAVLVVVAFVSIVVFAPSVTAPKLIASSELLMADARVTVPVVLSVTPPLNAKVSPDALPRFKVPSLLKLAAPLKLFVPPVKAMLATVLSALSAAAATLALKVAVPPTSAKVKLPNPLIAPDAVMSEFATLSPGC